MTGKHLGIEHIDRIDWMTREDAEFMFASNRPGFTLRRPSAHGYRLLGLPVPDDLDTVDDDIVEVPYDPTPLRPWDNAGRPINRDQDGAPLRPDFRAKYLAAREREAEALRAVSQTPADDDWLGDPGDGQDG